MEVGDPFPPLADPRVGVDRIEILDDRRAAPLSDDIRTEACPHGIEVMKAIVEVKPALTFRRF